MEREWPGVCSKRQGSIKKPRGGRTRGCPVAMRARWRGTAAFLQKGLAKNLPPRCGGNKCRTQQKIREKVCRAARKNSVYIGRGKGGAAPRVLSERQSPIRSSHRRKQKRGLACCTTTGAAAMLSRGGRAGKKSAPAAGAGGRADAFRVSLPAPLLFCIGAVAMPSRGSTSRFIREPTRFAARTFCLFFPREHFLYAAEFT